MKWRWIKLPKGLTKSPDTDIYYRIKVRGSWKEDIILVLLVAVFALMLYWVFF